MALFPECFGDWKWVDPHVVPPGGLVPGMVELAMMLTAKRDRELVADLAAEGGRLSAPEVMGIGGEPVAQQARLRGDEAKVLLVPMAGWLADRERTLIDPGGNCG